MPNLFVKRGLPIPAPRHTYPWRTLKVGESFDVPLRKWGTVRTAASQAARRLSRTFTVRKVSATTIRVWRTQ